MKTKNHKFKVITGAILTAMIVILAIPFRAKAAEELMITVLFYSAGMWDMEWEFPYSEQSFGCGIGFEKINRRGLEEYMT